MIDDPRVGELCQDIELLFRPYGFVPKFTAVPNINTVFASVENGLGVAVLDGWYQGIHHPGIHYFNLNDQLPISIAWKRNTISSSIDMLYKKINEHFTSND
jgi:DNA-binding transcriptional LysR family regulator